VPSGGGINICTRRFVAGQVLSCRLAVSVNSTERWGSPVCPFPPPAPDLHANPSQMVGNGAGLAYDKHRGRVPVGLFMYLLTADG
jgi:hypothetical protein